MNLLIVTQYFWPETFIINDLAKVLSQAGHEIVIATGKPNYPDGKVFPGYEVSGVQRESYESIDVFRAPLRPRGGGRARDLVLNYLSFVWSGLRYFPRLFKGRQFDIILVFAISPITAAIPAIALKYTNKAHLAVWVQDLWPESLAATGFVRNHWVLKAVGWMVRGIYACSDTLLIQSKAFHTPVSRYASESKIHYYPNSIDISIAVAEDAGSLPVNLTDLLENNFCLVFAGNIGTAQSVETLVSAAECLKDLADCKIVLVGSGSMLDWVEERKNMLGLDNLILAGRFPMNTMPQIYRRAAGLLVTLKNENIFSYTIPSKVQAYLAAGKPIVAAVNGQGAEVVNEAQAGITCAAEDHEALADNIRTLFAMSEGRRKQMGEAGRAYFMKHFEMNHQAERLIKLLEQRLAECGART